MWEKKDQANGLHNWDNTYPWQGTCLNRPTKFCGTDADCSSGGTCFVPGGKRQSSSGLHSSMPLPASPITATGEYPTSGSCKASWTTRPIFSAVIRRFNNHCTSGCITCNLGCTVDGANNTTECSCTQPAGPSKGYYWSGSTYAPSPIVLPRGSMLAWGVLFGDGDVPAPVRPITITYAQCVAAL